MTHFDRLKNTIVRQTDPHLPKSVQRYGCRAMCLMAIPQFVAGVALSELAIESILLHSLEEPDVMGKDWTCGKNEHWLIGEAFRRLQITRAGRQVGWTEEHIHSIPWEYMIVHWHTRGVDGHYTLFDKTQNEIYDPHDPRQAGYEIDKIEIMRKLVYRTWEV